MSDLLTISDVAARTGFSASALRFYEEAGLIDPVRSRSGYRLYDDRANERLQFIARAKQLGLSLEEITDLLVLWDGDRCAPVAGRLQELVSHKLDDTHERIAQLTALAADLQRFRQSLPDADGQDDPCGRACACTAAPSAADTDTTGRSEHSVPNGCGPAIACTLDPSDVTQRVNDWRQLLAHADGSPQSVEHGVRVRFDCTLASQVAALAIAEQRCCAFLRFDLRLDGNGVELTVTGAVEAKPVIDAVFATPI